jgi:pSer/pThr/pTyr-binding forkhead associated (FHA) protein
MGVSVRPTSGPTSVRLLHGGQAIVLVPGGYLIGRGAECHVMLEGARVSRIHARVVVDSRSATVEDMGSANGVFVNGRRIERQERLQDGDVLIVGGEELTVEISALSTVRVPRETLTELALTPVPPQRGPVQPQATAPTTKVNALALLAEVAERALAAGQPQQAETAVHARLLQVLDAAVQGTEPRADVAERALSLSLSLARALRARRWLDYAIDLLTALRWPCSEGLAVSLRGTLAVVGAMDTRRLAQYAMTVRALPATIDKVRTLALIEELERTARAR